MIIKKTIIKDAKSIKTGILKRIHLFTSLIHTIYKRIGKHHRNNIIRLTLSVMFAMFASIGLAFRIPKYSVPLQILDKNGTQPGFILSIAFMISSIGIKNKIFKTILFEGGVGIFTFATGASILSYVNNHSNTKLSAFIPERNNKYRKKE